MFRVLRRYSLVNAYSGQKLFCEMGNQSFNVFYTGVPLVLLGVLDRDVLASTAEAFPQASVVCAVFPHALTSGGLHPPHLSGQPGVSHGVCRAALRARRARRRVLQRPDLLVVDRAGARRGEG
jgi:hypothetical protein